MWITSANSSKYGTSVNPSTANQTTHADDAIRFAMECISLMDDADAQMNVAFELRIGIHTGGPVIAGVIGTDKLSFDIFGDAVAIAAKLENFGSNGKVHVSEDTYNLVSYSGNFRVESLEKK